MKKSPKKIAIFTGNRAEYGLIKPLLETIESSNLLEYTLIVSGNHLSKTYGKTSSVIEEDGFKIHYKVPMNPTNSLIELGHTTSNLLKDLIDVLAECNPDIVYVYADRIESFTYALAASMLHLPIIHGEGGDITEGGCHDDQIRHCITNLSHIHLVTNQASYQNLMQMGEEQWRIHNFGLPTLDSIDFNIFKNKMPAIIEEFSLDTNTPLILFTQHPIPTFSDKMNLESISDSCQALSQLIEKGYRVIATYPNGDVGSQHIIESLSNLSNKINDPKKFTLTPNLGIHKYHSLLYFCGFIGSGVCLGNTSSGIKEAASFHCPAVNIAPRQNGRLSGKSVITIKQSARLIEKAVVSFIKAAKNNSIFENPYYNGGFSEKAINLLENLQINNTLLLKKLTFNRNNIDEIETII